MVLVVTYSRPIIQPFLDLAGIICKAVACPGFLNGGPNISWSPKKVIKS